MSCLIHCLITAFSAPIAALSFKGRATLRPGALLEVAAPKDVETASIDASATSNSATTVLQQLKESRHTHWLRYGLFNIAYAVALFTLVPITQAMFLLPSYAVMLAGLYYGGLLLLVVFLPFASTVSTVILVIWLAVLKR